jgi:hypothetical protein
MASAAEAGDLPQASSFPFPAETVTMTPAATAFFTASLTGVQKSPPRLMLITALLVGCAFSTTQLIPSIAQDKYP